MAINGLKKGDRKTAEERSKLSINPDSFISGANNRVKSSNKRERIYKNATFSLNQECIDNINDLTYVPRNFKISRSGVVKAAIDLLINQPNEIKLDFLEKYKD